jgi:hypothetical protein
MRTPGNQPRILLTNVRRVELLFPREEDIELFDRVLLGKDAARILRENPSWFSKLVRGQV